MRIPVHVRCGKGGDLLGSRSDEWINNEVMGCKFQDVRHGKRMRQLLAQLSGSVEATTPRACQDWAITKAAYRFFSNERVTEANILTGHFASTREQFIVTAGFPMLVLYDATEISFTRENVESVGKLRKLTVGYAGKYRTTCGNLMHSSLATTARGLPLGLAAIKFWNRDNFHGANALKRRINPTRVPITQKESVSWLENIRQSAERS